jgi:RNA polymerase sigma factor (sigma-70 family)
LVIVVALMRLLSRRSVEERGAGGGLTGQRGQVGEDGRTDVAVVAAAQAGDPRALDDLIADHLPLVYNLVGRALRGHADVDDVVQETMLRVVHGLDRLRDPASFRSWLVAITMRQIQERWRDVMSVPTHSGGLGPLLDVADPGADFVDLTIVRLGLSGQRRQVAEATHWLDPDDQQLLSLWWLEAAGELTRADLAAGLRLSAGHAAVRVQRMKAQLEAARAIVGALWATPRCAQLDEVIRDWDGRPNPLWRKRIARHTRECADCAGAWSQMAPAEGLLAGLAMVPIPPATAAHVAAGLGSAAAATHASAAHSVAGSTLGWLGRLLHLAAAKPVAAITAGVVVAAGAGAAYEIYPDPQPHHAVLSPVRAPSPSASPARPTSAPPSAAPRTVAIPGYGVTVDQAEPNPPANRRPGPLPKRAQGKPVAGTGRYEDPAGGKYVMNFHGDYVTLRGQGYFWIRWQIVYSDRAGVLGMPTWTGLSGKLFHVASGGGKRMNDPVPGATDQPHTGMGQPSTGYDSLPAGAQQMWQNEYYYLDGTVTLHQNEYDADYNLIVQAKTWDQITADITTPPDPTTGPVRYGLVRDTGNDTAPVPQYLTLGNPADPAGVPQHSNVTQPG